MSTIAQEKALRAHLKRDFKFFSSKALIIRTKAGKLEYFKFNKAQDYLHGIIEKQLKETGKVRVLVLKGRQQGVSTYVEGRAVWKVSHRQGYRGFILTHLGDATNNLFNVSKRYVDNLPAPIRPTVGNSNAKELIFPVIDSGFAVGTAGNKAIGRSDTVQFFHGSEVAFWPNTAEISSGLLETIPEADDTEIILESTANGVGNFFHNMWKDAEKGANGYIPVFIPWYWQDEYRLPAAEDFTPNEKEQDLIDQFGLSFDQLEWRRFKISKFAAATDGTYSSGESLFKQEYPMTAAEAFRMSEGRTLIHAEQVMKARKATVKPVGPYIVGVDPSRGGDRFSTIKRCGRKMWDNKSRNFINYKLGDGISICKQILDTVDPVVGKKPDMMFIDAGFGADLVDRLHELGYQNVKAIAFQSSPFDKLHYTNKRGEMWADLGKWLRDESLPVDIPDSDSLHADLLASYYRIDSSDRIVLLSKDDIKTLIGYSPDEGDASALTFAEPVTSLLAGNEEQTYAEDNYDY